ncbi:MAG: UDP-N-acetylmuramate dehydrogenase [Bifidobacteriaceae bacterium]|jgi:UDP-N-acetylmuramate dehydrogenase|nr:UDP-N-acetylmuramate dehydrogenase [Bifidobacteriaceae bacterium]
MDSFELPLASAQAPADAALADLTSFRIGGRPARLIDCHTEAQVVAAVAEADDAGAPLLAIGGGSNLLAAERLDNLVVVRDRRGLCRAEERAGAVHLTVQAGASWDAVVALTVQRGWAGLAALSGIPGSAGATAVQNIGAYGAEVGQMIESIRAFDRHRQTIVELRQDQLDWSYRDSALKRSLAAGAGPTPRWVVLDLTFKLPVDRGGSPVNYEQLAASLGVKNGDQAPLAAIRQAVTEIRRAKGMILDPDDHDTWSAGSFFTNPVIDASAAAGLPPAAPQYPANGLVKTSAAWLITNAGIHRGEGVREGAAATTSTKHVLALTNRGGATCADILELAEWIADRVKDRFGIALTREPVLVDVRAPAAS